MAMIAFAAALGCADLAGAKVVTITTRLDGYDGPSAYMAYYLVNPQGKYEQTVWINGGSASYRRHLSHWARFIARKPQRIDGITGASIGSGRGFRVSVELSDAMLNSGYALHVESSVENLGSFPDDAIVPLTDANSGRDVAGTGFVKSVTVTW